MILHQIFYYDTLYHEQGTFTTWAEGNEHALKLFEERAKIEGIEYQLIQVKPVLVMGKEIKLKDVE